MLSHVMYEYNFSFYSGLYHPSVATCESQNQETNQKLVLDFIKGVLVGCPSPLLRP